MERIEFDGGICRVIRVNTAVVGSGAAGLAATERLSAAGTTDLIVLTEALNFGTSRNTGSDKQTYYKLALAGEDADSPRRMAQTLFDGGSMDGDLALVEASLSTPCFFHLCELGVPFPHNQFGEYVGYQTDHDPLARGTSVGPLTSQCMHKCLAEALKRRGIRILERVLAVRILTHGGDAAGLLAVDLSAERREDLYLLVNCTNIVYATGGPAGLYAASVYPASQIGMSGAALEAGVIGKNLGEWQYGLASTGYRWNLSGSYQQVLPRYYSVDPADGRECDFLSGAFPDEEALLQAIFLKGYQWPFDPDKALNGGSSVIDLLVYRETVLKGRKVFLDYRRNPPQLSGADGLRKAGEAAYQYLTRSGALQQTPIERLKAMNYPAYLLYREHGIDLEQEPIEIAVCAQHNNGGLSGDAWWESNLRHFFPVGEACGSHGVKRPGGSALNAGQVGGLRAAERIAAVYWQEPPEMEEFLNWTRPQIEKLLELTTGLRIIPGKSNVAAARRTLQERMTRYAAHVRSEDGLATALGETARQLEAFASSTVLDSWRETAEALRNRDLLLTQQAYLASMIAYVRGGGESRGSYLIVGDKKARHAGGFCFSLDERKNSGVVLETQYRAGAPCCRARAVRPIPERDDWYEKVWKEYRKNGRSVL